MIRKKQLYVNASTLKGIEHIKKGINKRDLIVIFTLLYTLLKQFYLNAIKSNKAAIESKLMIKMIEKRDPAFVVCCR